LGVLIPPPCSICTHKNLRKPTHLGRPSVEIHPPYPLRTGPGCAGMPSLRRSWRCDRARTSFAGSLAQSAHRQASPERCGRPPWLAGARPWPGTCSKAGYPVTPLHVCCATWPIDKSPARCRTHAAHARTHGALGAGDWRSSRARSAPVRNPDIYMEWAHFAASQSAFKN
jgi:hypothetical protein